YISNFKKIILICISEAVRSFDKKLVSEQEVLNNIADMIMVTYVSESLVLRVAKRETMKENIPVYRDILDTYIYDSSSLIRRSAYDAVYSMSTADKVVPVIKAIEALTSVKGVNVRDARRRIADKLIEDNTYSF
ncbi:MAG: hypothetical protein JXN62_05145, partial [Bacteroidales bacterium]|nr:hypothetical protein [Bacteroidales bacterium]